MPTATTSGLNIIGTYPIINKQISSIDDNGVETLSYIFTVKTEDAYRYIPSKDDVYYGPTGASTPSGAQTFSSSLSLDVSSYLVTSVSVDNLNGGLTQIIVNTAGSRNVQTPPKIRLLPNYPLIFGLKGVTGDVVLNPSWPYSYVGNGGARRGFGVMMTFITKNTITDESQIYLSYSNKLMPSVFRGTILPVPQLAPFSYNSRNYGDGSIGQNSSSSSIQSTYRGFICGETTYTKVGGVIVFQLIYREMGSAYTSYCPPISAGASSVQCETTKIYSFD